jgi:hypothetical protein
LAASTRLASARIEPSSHLRNPLPWHAGPRQDRYNPNGLCPTCRPGYGSEWTGIIFRQTYKQLRDLISKSKRWFPRAFPSARWNNTDKCWTFAGGETLFLQQFNREDDYWNFHGHEYPFIGWDELTNWPDLTGYKRMMSCCRSSNPSVPRKSAPPPTLMAPATMP